MLLMNIWVYNEYKYLQFCDSLDFPYLYKIKSVFFAQEFLVKHPKPLPMESSLLLQKIFIMEWWSPIAAKLVIEGKSSLIWWVNHPYTVPAVMVKLESGVALLLSALNSANVHLPMLKMQSWCLKAEACFP